MIYVELSLNLLTLRNKFSWNETYLTQTILICNLTIHTFLMHSLNNTVHSNRCSAVQVRSLVKYWTHVLVKQIYLYISCCCLVVLHCTWYFCNKVVCFSNHTSFQDTLQWHWCTLYLRGSCIWYVGIIDCRKLKKIYDFRVATRGEMSILNLKRIFPEVLKLNQQAGRQTQSVLYAFISWTSCKACITMRQTGTPASTLYEYNCAPPTFGISRFWCRYALQIQHNNGQRECWHGRSLLEVYPGPPSLIHP